MSDPAARIIKIEVARITSIIEKPTIEFLIGLIPNWSKKVLNPNSLYPLIGAFLEIRLIRVLRNLFVICLQLLVN